MSRSRRVATTLLTAALAAAPTSACDGDSEEECRDRTLDLREPLTREDFDLQPGDTAASWSCDDGLDLIVELPLDTSMELQASSVTADTYGGQDPETADPAAVTIHTPSASVDDVAALATRIAGQLAMKPAEIESWRAEAHDPVDKTVDTKSTFISGSAGSLNASMQLIHDPTGDRNNLHLRFYLR